MSDIISARAVALQCAIAAMHPSQHTTEKILIKAAVFETYILTGVK